MKQCVCLLALTWPALAQFTTEVTVVNVFATVHDRNGTLIHDLVKGDFTIEENAKQQQVGYFSQQTDLPLTLGLLVDTSASMLRVLGTERDASRQFFKQVLREKQDQAFLVHFDRQVELWQPLTPSRKKLDAGLGQLDPQTWFQKHLGPGQHGTASTALYDAIVISSTQVMRKESGRKAIILMSDGMDAGSRATLEQALEAAERADTLVYSIHIYAEDPEAALLSPSNKRKAALARGKEVLQKISQETGGGFYEVKQGRPLATIFSEIQEELRNQYSLGFTPDAADRANGLHKITVSVRQAGLTVQARSGYYVGP